ncbi:MAG: hypothetical protein D6782_11690, partial [Alphaproteobacteria bacterium]
MSNRPVVFIGFDGMDIGLVTDWAQAGLMPTFARLFQTAPHFTVAYPRGLEAGSHWPSLITGVPVSVHGQFDGLRIFDDYIYDKRQRMPQEFVVDPLWVHASRGGKRVAVVDLPYSVPTPGINGVQVVDWLTHVRRDEGLASIPRDYAAQLIRDYGVNPLYAKNNNCPANALPLDTAARIRQLQADLHWRVDAKTRMTLDLMRRENWDLFMTVFHDAHDVGHMLWHVHDPGHERHDASLAAALGDPVRDIYVCLDAALADILAALGDRAVAFVLCSLGMGPDRSASGFLDVLLMHLQRAYAAQERPARATGPSRRTLAARLFGLYGQMVPTPVRRSLRRAPVFRRLYRRSLIKARRKRPFLELTATHATGGIRI